MSKAENCDTESYNKTSLSVATTFKRLVYTKIPPENIGLIKKLFSNSKVERDATQCRLYVNQKIVVIAKLEKNGEINYWFSPHGTCEVDRINAVKSVMGITQQSDCYKQYA